MKHLDKLVPIIESVRDSYDSDDTVLEGLRPLIEALKQVDNAVMHECKCIAVNQIPEKLNTACCCEHEIKSAYFSIGEAFMKAFYDQLNEDDPDPPVRVRD